MLAVAAAGRGVAVAARATVAEVPTNVGGPRVMNAGPPESPWQVPVEDSSNCRIALFCDHRPPSVSVACRRVPEVVFPVSEAIVIP
jgi:hypothetical protein